MAKWVRANINTLPHTEVWDRVMAYYKAAAPEDYNALNKHYTTVGDQRMHLDSIVDSGFYLHMNACSEHININIVDEITKVIKPTYGPVSYIDAEGKRVTTIDNVLIGSLDMIILEKTEQRPMAVSSATLQHHGLISGNNKEIRNAHPSKQQSTRVLGETECRLIAAVMGGDILAEMLDLANSPESHREAVWSILNAEDPSNILSVVNREITKLGRSRVLSFFNHILLCNGVAIVDD